MQRKIELHEIMAYAPYGLKVALTEHKDSFEGEDYYDEQSFSKGAIWTLSGYADPSLNIPMGEGEINGLIFSKGSTYISITSDFKPLLLPLSALQDDPNHILGLGHIELNRKTHTVAYTLAQYQYIFANHLDIFNLIPDNLALDKRDYEP